MKIDFDEQCNTPSEDVERNLKENAWRKRVEWGTALYPYCAVVGAGPSLKRYLPVLREWKGDIFAINDTAGYLSDEGIPCYLYMMDAGPSEVRRGIHIKGALMASRCNPVNFIYRDTLVWDMLDDFLVPGFAGVEGGPSAPCRAPHLLLRMGYRGVCFFGCDSSFYDTTHLSGARPEAHDFMMIIRVNGIDYVTNAAMLQQAKYLAKVITRHPLTLLNCSDGMLKAFVEHYDEWDVVGVGKDIKDEWDKAGVYYWNKPYEQKVEKVWRPSV